MSGSLLKSAELKDRLGIDERTLRQLLREGMPVDRSQRVLAYDPEEVDRWLVDAGYAVEEPVEQICRTYAELAIALDMRTRNPERQIASWVNDPTFPGRAGSQGRRDAWLPVEQIKRWLASRGSAYGGGEVDAELAALKRENERLTSELHQTELLQQLGRLADVDEVAAYCRQCVADARAMLESLPDAVVAVLPAKTTTDTRRKVHGKVQQAVRDALEELARMVEGDTDETEDDTDEE